MHLIFDLDGTLINSLPGIAYALNASLAEHGLEQHPIEVVREFIGDGSWMLCRKAVPDVDEDVVNAVNASFILNYANLWLDGTTIYDGILDLLATIPEGHHLSILSNKPHAFTADIASKIFPEHTFDTVLGQREGIAKKPDPKGIHEIIEQSGHEDKRAFLIGDSTVDLQTAKNAEIGSIAVTWGFEDADDLRSISPDHIVSDTVALKALLSSLSA